MTSLSDKTSDLSRSWYDPAWVPALNQANILDYFMQHSNPFYDRTCNNELVKMQRLNPEQLLNMNGVEYVLLLHQEPILYVVRKRQRHSPTHTIPLIDYYIIAGVVYQSPDLQSVISSRLLNTIYNLESAFETSLGYQSFSPSQGYWWDFKNSKYQEETSKVKAKNKEEPSSLFQRQRVDLLLVELSKKFPLQQQQQQQQQQQPVSTGVDNKPADDMKTEVVAEVKVEKPDEKPKPTVDTDMKPPPEKKMKTFR